MQHNVTHTARTHARFNSALFLEGSDVGHSVLHGTDRHPVHAEAQPPHIDGELPKQPPSTAITAFTTTTKPGPRPLPAQLLQPVRQVQELVVLCGAVPRVCGAP